MTIICLLYYSITHITMSLENQGINFAPSFDSTKHIKQSICFHAEGGLQTIPSFAGGAPVYLMHE